MQVGDMVRVKLSQSLLGHSQTGIITASKGFCRSDRRASRPADRNEIFWVLVNGHLSTYGSNQLIKVAQ